MNVVMSSPTQNSNAPSIIRIAKQLEIKDKEIKEKLSSVNEEYGKMVFSLSYFQDFLKSLEQVENKIMQMEKGYISSYGTATDRNSFNNALASCEDYITVTPF